MSDKHEIKRLRAKEATLERIQKALSSIADLDIWWDPTQRGGNDCWRVRQDRLVPQELGLPLMHLAEVLREECQ